MIAPCGMFKASSRSSAAATFADETYVPYSQLAVA